MAERICRVPCERRSAVKRALCRRKNLKTIKVDGRSLEGLLLEANLADMPYNKGRRWRKELGENVEAFLEDIGEPGLLSSAEAQDALFYAYWHDFFRFARKAAAGKGGEE